MGKNEKGMLVVSSEGKAGSSMIATSEMVG